MRLSVKCACGATFNGVAEKGSLQTPDLMAAYLTWTQQHAGHTALPTTPSSGEEPK